MGNSKSVSSLNNDLSKADIGLTIKKMHSLAVDYHKLGNYVMMKKYYLMAIELGFPNSMNNLALYYCYAEKKIS